MTDNLHFLDKATFCELSTEETLISKGALSLKRTLADSTLSTCPVVRLETQEGEKKVLVLGVKLRLLLRDLNWNNYPADETLAAYDTALTEMLRLVEDVMTEQSPGILDYLRFLITGRLLSRKHEAVLARLSKILAPIKEVSALLQKEKVE